MLILIWWIVWAIAGHPTFELGYNAWFITLLLAIMLKGFIKINFN